MDVPVNLFQILMLLQSTIGDKITDINIAKQFLSDYDKMAMDVEYNYMEAAWMYKTNITDENQNNQVSIKLNLSISFP